MDKWIFCINDKFNVIKSEIQEQKCDDFLSFSDKNTYGVSFIISKNYLNLYDCPGEFDKYSIQGYIDDFSNDEKIKIVFAYYHNRLNILLELLNKALFSGGHFWARNSNELISVKSNILELIDSGITMNSYYKGILGKINFLKGSGGSEIPQNFSRIKLIKYEQVFWIDKNSNLSNNDVKKLKDNISLSSNDYRNFNDDEKIRYLNESIEFLLKNQRGKFEEIKKNMFFGLISNENCLEYRKMTHIFRHHSIECIENRKRLKDYDKKFLVNYGETIVNRIIALQKNEKNKFKNVVKKIK